ASLPRKKEFAVGQVEVSGCAEDHPFITTHEVKTQDVPTQKAEIKEKKGKVQLARHSNNISRRRQRKPQNP
ncbi:hypothetical protein, partial [Bacteroides heparinolyticus]|uniref:hypothetical protein n=1 Tax=Prevotella heparinolytica TaxID=28113 RepID=UPI0035A11021